MLFSKKKIGVVADLINIPLLIIRGKGEISDVNAAFCKLLSVKKEDLAGRTFHDIAALKPMEKHISRALTTNTPFTQRHNLGEIYYEVSAYPLVLDGIHYTVVSLYDISPFMMLEKELLKRNRELMIINSLSEAFISSENIEGVFNELLDKILLITDFTVGWIMIKVDHAFEKKSHIGISKSLNKAITDGRLNELCASMETMNDPLYVYEVDEINEIHELEKEGIYFLSATPIRVGKQFKGILFLASRIERTLDFDLASLLTLIGRQSSLIIEKVELFNETRRLSITDSLTDLFNSRYFYKALDKEIARSNRYKTPFSLAIFDIDDFKSLNDTYGHQAGDEVLRNIAGILRAESRETDIIARYGGEEFVIIFPNTVKKRCGGGIVTDTQVRK